MKRITVIIAFFAVALVAYAQGELIEIVIPNLGTNALEGHTPRGFEGMGTGLFTGDNININFPEGDGVQIFITFDLSELTGGVQSAVLRSEDIHITGTPFEDLLPPI